ncbi:MAG: Ig-like domain-containing protein [Alphaproteobacteria bacterium]|nr:Ig-like domain-containing protein [Alphaproteobacteria bacterium]
MLRHAWWLGILVACSGDTDTDNDTADADADADTDADSDADADADTDADSDADTDCTALITTVTPADLSVDVALNQPIVVAFDQAITDTDPHGVTVSNATGSLALASDGLSMTWTPSTPYDRNTTYDVTATVCDDSLGSSFVTSNTVNPADVAGNTYAVPWVDTRVTINEPPNGAALFFTPALFPIDYVMLQVLSIDPLTGDAPAAATVGLDDGFGQPVPDCTVVIRETGSFAQNPLFTFAGDLQIVIAPGQFADVEDFALEGTFSSDGSALTAVHMTGMVATEQFIDVPGPLPANCNSIFVAAFNPTCVPCTISNSGQCMLVDFTATQADLYPFVDIDTTCPP